MCEPVTILAATAAVTSAVGAGLGAVSANNQAQYQAQVAKNNAKLADRAAADAIARGAVAEQNQRSKTRQQLAAFRASAAARGVAVDEGSALDVQETGQALGNLDALTIRSNAEREALGFKSQSMNFISEAGLQKSAGQSALIQGGLSATGSLLEGGSAVAAKWYPPKKAE